MEFEPGSLYCGDCLEAMREWPDGCVDLCYLDPPFNSKADYNILFGKKRGKAPAKYAQAPAFADTWHWSGTAAERVSRLEKAAGSPVCDVIRGLKTVLGESGMLAYLSYMAERLVEIRRVLKDTGSVYLHCDPTASHYLKLVMDAVFKGGFRNEIVWSYPASPSSAVRDFPRKHDTVLRYAASDNWIFNADAVRVPYSRASLDRIKYQANASTVMAGTDILLNKNGKLPTTVWQDIPQTYRLRGENLGYPTQKPLALLDRIVKASSNEGDVVLDPFCGCGTALESSARLRRRWIGIDVSHFAVDLIRDRRLKDRSIKVHGFPMDMACAEMLAREQPLEFEKWAVTRIPGMVPNERRGGDGGVDGFGYLHGAENHSGLALAQVKGGKATLSQVRDFLHVIQRDDAMSGVFITLRKSGSGKAGAEMRKLGVFRIGVREYPRAQLWSAEEYFDDPNPNLPALADPYTGKRMTDSLFDNPQRELV